MKHLKGFKLFNEELHPFGTHFDSGKILTFKELLEDSDFQDIYDNLMEPDGFEIFKKEFGLNDTLTYEISGSSLLIYFTDKNILDDLYSVCGILGADEVTIQDGYIKCWFD